MSFPTIPFFNREPAINPDGYVEIPKTLAHEVVEGLRPMATERNHRVVTSVDQHVMPFAQERLGADVIGAILAAIDMAPVEPPRAEDIQYAEPVAEYIASPAMAGAPAIVQREQQSGFWGDDPDDQRLMKSAAWEGDVAPAEQDQSKLQTVATAEEFFQSDFQMMPQSTIDQMPAYDPTPYRTEQDLPQEAGMANPRVDETRVFMDDLDAMAEMPEAGSWDNHNADEIAARVEAARQQVSEARV